MEAVLRYIQTRAFRRAFRGRHTAWAVVGAAAWMMIRARHQDDVVYRTELRPGERLVVSTDNPSPSGP